MYINFLLSRVEMVFDLDFFLKVKSHFFPILPRLKTNTKSPFWPIFRVFSKNYE